MTPMKKRLKHVSVKPRHEGGEVAAALDYTGVAQAVSVKPRHEGGEVGRGQGLPPEVI